MPVNNGGCKKAFLCRLQMTTSRYTKAIQDVERLKQEIYLMKNGFVE